MIETEINEEIIENNSKGSNSMVFFNSLRGIAMILVIIFHAAGSYSIASLYWGIQDPTKDLFSDFIRYALDVFIMPTFFL